ncbi:MAG: SurA N-terminal domain-containing protein [Acidobacteria bacterium]|nr:SurA N-terminal domain-containing protein [Acidobacteriota bacterium]
MDKFKGVISSVQINRKGLVALLSVTLTALIFTACGNQAGNTGPGGVDPNETAAKVNGKIIKMEDVDRAVKQQAQGQETKMSPLELAGARLQVLDTLIQQEVMYQKAEKENLVPSDEDVTGEINKQKQGSGLSADEFDKQMKAAGLDEKSYRENIKRGLAIQKLVDKVTSRIETPKDAEIEQFFKSNPDMFVKKRGVRLAAIVVDPSNSGEGDVTRNAQEADQRLKEIMEKVSMPGSDFAALAREYSEDGSKLQGGDLGYISEQELKQNFGEQIAAGFMSADFSQGKITAPIPFQGKRYIFKCEDKVEKDENLTLESPDVRPQINKLLVDNRKQLLAMSYQAIAMNEAKIENFLAKKVVDNPNELSGARPAGAVTPPTADNSNAAAPANTNSGASNSNANTSATKPANASTPKPAATAAKPAATPAAKPAATANK